MRLFGGIAGKRLIIRNEKYKEVAKMSYQKPEVKKVEVHVKVNTEASEQSSCYGGHCVKARYGNDY